MASNEFDLSPDLNAAQVTFHTRVLAADLGSNIVTPPATVHRSFREVGLLEITRIVEATGDKTGLFYDIC